MANSEFFDVSSEVSSEEFIVEEVPLLVFRVIGCTVVTLLVGFTIIIYVTAGMFYVDCLAQICCESCIFVAYMLILLTTTEPFKINSAMCLTISVFLHLFFVSASLFLLLEVLCMCQVHLSCFPKVVQTSTKNILLVGWLCPILITVTSAIVWHKQYTTRRNCWLRTDQPPYWPTLIPMMSCSCLQIILILVITMCPVPAAVSEEVYKRAKCYRTTRWASAFITVMLCLSWSFGVRAYHTGEETFFAAFTVASIFLGVFIFILRISTDEEIREKVTVYLLCWLQPQNRVNSTSSNAFMTKKIYSEGIDGARNGKLPSAEEN